MQGQHLHLLQLLTLLKRQWPAGVTRSLIIRIVPVASLRVDSEFQTAAHSSPPVRLLLMDDKGGEKMRLKIRDLSMCVCCVLSRSDVL